MCNVAKTMPQSTEHSNTYLRSLRPTSEFDDELINDFEWLINFDVRKILQHGIDEQNHEDKMHIRPKNYLKNNDINKHEHRRPLVGTRALLYFIQFNLKCIYLFQNYGTFFSFWHCLSALATTAADKSHIILY